MALAPWLAEAPAADASGPLTMGPGAETPEDKLLGVLVTYRRPDDLSLMLDLLATQEVQLARLVVVDNSPSLETEEIVGRHSRERPGVEYVPAAENLGPAGGIALGMEALLGRAQSNDWIVLLDDDDPPRDPSALRQLREFGRSMRVSEPRTAGVGLAGARFNWRSGRLTRIQDHQLQGPVPVDYIGGSQLPCYLAGVIGEVGVFHRPLFFGFDDLEFGLRLRRAGYHMYAPGPLWLERRRCEGRTGITGRPSVRVGEPTWRRYYSLRNLIHILRSAGAVTPAVWVTLVHGIGKPATNMLHNPGQATRYVRLSLRACVDGWSGRMGRTVDPSS
jgi:glycosyltransferase involved in cell wall biosynthesis